MRRLSQALLLTVLLGAAACAPPGFLSTPTETTVEGSIRAPIGALFPSSQAGATVGPVADATVYLLDETGRLVHEVKAVATDNQGHYRLVGVPVGKTFVVAAVTPGEGGQMVVLKSLVQTTANADQKAQAVDIDLGSTLATDAVAKLGPQGLTYASPEEFKRAQTAIGTSIATSGQVPNLTAGGSGGAGSEGGGGTQALLEAWLKANPSAAAAIAALEASVKANAAAAAANGGQTPILTGGQRGPTPTPRPQTGPTAMPESTPTPTPSVSMKPVEKGTIFIDSRHRYLPHTVFLKVGGSVVFVNQSDAEHRIMPDIPGDFEDTGGIQPKKVSNEVKFDKVGEYAFFCELHEANKGKIVVVAE